MEKAVGVRRAALAEIVDLRHATLRQGLPRESAIFAGDDAPDARHYAALHDERVLGCATVHRSHWDGEPAWQLRGMAVAREQCGRGIGRAILAFLEADLLASAARAPAGPLLWCNARVPASGFYRRLGWVVCSEPFEIPTAGPHVKMTRRLGGGTA